MNDTISNILAKESLSKSDIVSLLNAKNKDRKLLFEKANEVKKKYIGTNTYYRGLIEFSNICAKDCYYCGIRKSNKNVERYQLSDEEILKAAEFAYKEDYGSVVLQGGELFNSKHIARITNLLKSIKSLSNDELGITISLGEQTIETFKEWFDAGAHRFLLRIETSNQDLYKKLHPDDDMHSFQVRLDALKNLKKSGYQTGTGVMVGLPFQTVEDLADDLLFMKDLDIDMCGMGPFLPHQDTPLYQYKDELWAIEERFDMTLKMIAILRILMKDINIAATTALQAIDKIGREKAIKIGANIIMPNITPGLYRDNYSLYENKPCTDEEAEDCKTCLEARITIAGDNIGYGEWGDSPHFKARTSNKK